ncbi:MAG: hypothetical protein M0C28_25845 [Candidatus Moduliflexus flocculans]|nr:hypothetical protein [Candidatus Moduliflexus flocculans]
MPVDVARKEGKAAGTIRGNDLFRRNVFAIQAFQLFDLAGAKPGEVAPESLLNWSYSLSAEDRRLKGNYLLRNDRIKAFRYLFRFDYFCFD